MEWWRRLLVWFQSIFMNKRVEKKEHPPPLKPKRIRSKESRERFLRRRAEKRQQRLLEEQTNRVEDMAEMAEVGASQGGKPEEEVNPSPLFPCSSDSLPHKELIEKSEDETSAQNISEERSAAQKEH